MLSFEFTFAKLRTSVIARKLCGNIKRSTRQVPCDELDRTIHANYHLKPEHPVSDFEHFLLNQVNHHEMSHSILITTIMTKCNESKMTIIGNNFFFLVGISYIGPKEDINYNKCVLIIPSSI